MRSAEDKVQGTMSKFGKELIESMGQAAKLARGKKIRGTRVTKVQVPDVKAIRRSCSGLSARHQAAAQGDPGGRRTSIARPRAPAAHIVLRYRIVRENWCPWPDSNQHDVATNRF